MFVSRISCRSAFSAARRATLRDAAGLPSFESGTGGRTANACNAIISPPLSYKKVRCFIWVDILEQTAFAVLRTRNLMHCWRSRSARQRHTHAGVCTRPQGEAADRQGHPRILGYAGERAGRGHLLGWRGCRAARRYPDPAVAFLTIKHKADAGIVISASHNSFEYNGIKIFAGNGYKLPDETEARIEDLIDDFESIPKMTHEKIGRVLKKARSTR